MSFIWYLASREKFGSPTNSANIFMLNIRTAEYYNGLVISGMVVLLHKCYTLYLAYRYTCIDVPVEKRIRKEEEFF